MATKPKSQPKSKAVATTASATAPDLPDYMKGDVGRGTEAIGTGDIETPRIKLIQAISPELDAFDELKSGDFFHTIAEESLGRALKIVPIYIDQRYILWRPREDGGGILARADDGIHWSPPSGSFTVKLKGKKDPVTWELAPTVRESGLAEWGSMDPDDPNSAPAATKMYNIVAGLPDFPDHSPVVITLQRSGIRVARKFMGKLKITRAPSFGLVFEMTSVQETGDSGPFQNYNFRSVGLVEDKDTYEQYKHLYEQFRDAGLQIKDLEGLQDEDAEVDAEATGDEPAY